MKINLNKAIIDNLSKTLERNINYSDMLYDFLEYFDEINEANNMGDFEEMFKFTYDSNESPKFLKLDESEFINNPYILCVKPREIYVKSYQLAYKQIPTTTPLFINDVKINNFKEEIDLGYFDKGYKYLSLSKNKNIWMEITPHEINTMEQSIENAFGNVLIYGLGLGYFAFMVSLKDNVKDIYIVEKDKEIIDIFVQNILPFFKDKNKIHIINEDALFYVNPSEIDYCFADLWHDASDGLPLYIELLKREKTNIKYDYWIEESLIEIARRYLILLIIGEKDDSDIFSMLEKKTKDIQLSSEEELNIFLSNESIKKLLKSE